MINASGTPGENFRLDQERKVSDILQRLHEELERMKAIGFSPIEDGEKNIWKNSNAIYALLDTGQILKKPMKVVYKLLEQAEIHIIKLKTIADERRGKCAAIPTITSKDEPIKNSATTLSSTIKDNTLTYESAKSVGWPIQSSIGNMPTPPKDEKNAHSSTTSYIYQNFTSPLQSQNPTPLPSASPNIPPITDRVNTKSPVREPLLVKSSPTVASPAIYFRYQCLDQGIEDAAAVDLLKKKIDDAPSLIANFNKPFTYSLPMTIEKQIAVMAFEVSEDLEQKYGVRVAFDNGAFIFSGTPMSGFDGSLHFSFVNDNKPICRHVHVKPLYISADPKALWQNLPVIDDEGYPTQDEEYVGRSLNALGRNVIAASVRGRSHAHVGKPRDDAFAVDFDEATGWCFVAVADGAGSAKYSRKGSRIACDVSLSVLRKFLIDPMHEEQLKRSVDRLADWRQAFNKQGGALPPDQERPYRDAFKFDAIFHNAIYSAYLAISDEAKQRGAQVKDYHTTLLCVAFKRFPFGYFMTSYWVGDGGLALYGWNLGERVLVLGAPDGGEFAGQTRFLTTMEEITESIIHQRMRYTFCDDFIALLLATDGITDPFFPSENDVCAEDKWHHFWKTTLPYGDAENQGCPIMFDPKGPLDERARALCKWLGFWSKGNHDDRTLLIVT